MLCTPEEEAFELKLLPAINEVVHFENDSYIVSCQASGTRLRWLDSKGEWIGNDKGRIHVEDRGTEVVLVFTSISSDDNGNWTCEAEKENRKISFSMIVYSEMNL